MSKNSELRRHLAPTRKIICETFLYSQLSSMRNWNGAKLRILIHTSGVSLHSSASHVEVRMFVASRASYLEIRIDMRRTFDLGWG